MTVSPGDKVLLLVRHVTRFEYAAAAIQGYSEVRKTPMDTALQRVLTTKLEVEPAVALRSYDDYFGSRVHYFNHLEPHEEVVVTAESVVETLSSASYGVEYSPDPRPWQQRTAEFMSWSASVPDLEQYAQIEHAVSTDLPSDGFLKELLALAHTFRARFRHDPDATHVHSTPEVLFEQGGGVCQDLAHAMLGVLRRAGVPGRYVSGYVYDTSRDVGGEHGPGSSASHAWVQAWHPALGWVGVDPSHRQLTDWRYVCVAVGRDYTDVQPIRGVFVGNHEQRLSVEVTVSRLT